MRRHVRVPAVRSMGMNSCVCVRILLYWLARINSKHVRLRSVRARGVIMESETRQGSALGDYPWGENEFSRPEAGRQKSSVSGPGSNYYYIFIVNKK